MTNNTYAGALKMTLSQRTFFFWVLLLAGLLSWQSAVARELPDFTDLVEQAAPGVINTCSTRMLPGRSHTLEGFGRQVLPEIFRHFFGDRFPAPPGRGGSGRSHERPYLRSGSIVSDDGYILSNAH